MNCSECNGKRTQNPFIKNGMFITFNKRNTAFLRSPTWFSGDVVKYFFSDIRGFFIFAIYF